MVSTDMLNPRIKNKQILTPNDIVLSFKDIHLHMTILNSLELGRFS
jgi:hypothetical protein